MTTPTPEELLSRIESAISLAFEGEGEAWSDKLSGDRLANVARRAVEPIIESLSAQVAQLQGERVATSADWRLIRSRGYKALASERDFTGHTDDGRKTAFYEGFKLGRSVATLGAATQPENEGEVRDELGALFGAHSPDLDEDGCERNDPWCSCGLRYAEYDAHMVGLILAKFTVSRRPALSEGEMPQPTDSRADS